jgi:hypothetical protein
MKRARLHKACVSIRSFRGCLKRAIYKTQETLKLLQKFLRYGRVSNEKVSRWGIENTAACDILYSEKDGRPDLTEERRAFRLLSSGMGGRGLPSGEGGLSESIAQSLNIKGAIGKSNAVGSDPLLPGKAGEHPFRGDPSVKCLGFFYA